MKFEVSKWTSQTDHGYYNIKKSLLQDVTLGEYTKGNYTVVYYPARKFSKRVGGMQSEGFNMFNEATSWCEKHNIDTIKKLQKSI